MKTSARLLDATAAVENSDASASCVFRVAVPEFTIQWEGAPGHQIHEAKYRLASIGILYGVAAARPPTVDRWASICAVTGYHHRARTSRPSRIGYLVQTVFGHNF